MTCFDLDEETRAFLEAPLDGFTEHMADAIAEPLLDSFFVSDAYHDYRAATTEVRSAGKGFIEYSEMVVEWPRLAIGLLVNEHLVSPVHATPSDLQRLITDTIGGAPWFDGRFDDLTEQLAAFWSYLTTEFDAPHVHQVHAYLTAVAVSVAA